MLSLLAGKWQDPRWRGSSSDFAAHFISLAGYRYSDYSLACFCLNPRSRGQALALLFHRANDVRHFSLVHPWSNRLNWLPRPPCFTPGHSENLASLRLLKFQKSLARLGPDLIGLQASGFLQAEAILERCIQL